jgi:hypothetical protein
MCALRTTDSQVSAMVSSAKRKVSQTHFESSFEVELSILVLLQHIVSPFQQFYHKTAMRKKLRFRV